MEEILLKRQQICSVEDLKRIKSTVDYRKAVETRKLQDRFDLEMESINTKFEAQLAEREWCYIEFLFKKSKLPIGINYVITPTTRTKLEEMHYDVTVNEKNTVINRTRSSKATLLV